MIDLLVLNLIKISLSAKIYRKSSHPIGFTMDFVGINQLHPNVVQIFNLVFSVFMMITQKGRCLS